MGETGEGQPAEIKPENVKPSSNLNLEGDQPIEEVEAEQAKELEAKESIAEVLNRPVEDIDTPQGKEQFNQARGQIIAWLVANRAMLGWDEKRLEALTTKLSGLTNKELTTASVTELQRLMGAQATGLTDFKGYLMSALVSRLVRRGAGSKQEVMARVLELDGKHQIYKERKEQVDKVAGFALAGPDNLAAWFNLLYSIFMSELAPEAVKSKQ